MGFVLMELREAHTHANTNTVDFRSCALNIEHIGTAAEQLQHVLVFGSSAHELNVYVLH